jgi:Synergist-CTERM protein sorting domain-containing protein
MGAFYIMDPRATDAVTTLMRQGVEVYKLKHDVTLPQATTQKFYGPNYNANWGITKNRAEYINVFTTKVPRTRADVIDNFSTEANKISPNYGSTNPDGVPWVPLTAAQTPTLEDAPEAGGGDWMTPLPEHLVAKAGYYVISIAQKWGRYAGYQMEPRSNCGLLFWAHWDTAVGGSVRGNDYTIVDKFNLDLVKTFDFTTIPASALERVIFTEDRNDKPSDTFAPPYLHLDGNFFSLTNAGATVTETVQNTTTGDVTITIKDACLNDEQWLTFFFYDNPMKDPIAILGQVFESAPGTYSIVFGYEELQKEGLVLGKQYAIHYSNPAGDIIGYGTYTKGLLEFNELKELGCNAFFAAFALLAIIPFALRRR